MADKKDDSKGYMQEVEDRLFAKFEPLLWQLIDISKEEVYQSYMNALPGKGGAGKKRRSFKRPQSEAED